MFYDVSSTVINGSHLSRSRKEEPLAILMKQLHFFSLNTLMNVDKTNKVIRILKKCVKLNSSSSSFMEIARIVDKWIVSSHFFDLGLITSEQFFALGAGSRNQKSYIQFFQNQRNLPQWRDSMHIDRSQFTDFYQRCFSCNEEISLEKIKDDISNGLFIKALTALQSLCTDCEECSDYYYLFDFFIDKCIQDSSPSDDYLRIQMLLKGIMEARPELLMKSLTNSQADLVKRLEFFKYYLIDLGIENETGYTLLEYAVNICDQNLLIALCELGCNLKNIQWRLLDEASFLEVMRRVDYLIYHFDRKDALEGCALGQESWQWKFVLEKGLFKSAIGAIEKFDFNLYGHEMYNTLIHEVLKAWNKLGMNYSDSQVRDQMQSLELHSNLLKRKCDLESHFPKRQKVSLKLNKGKRRFREDHNQKRMRLE